MPEVDSWPTRVLEKGVSCPRAPLRTSLRLLVCPQIRSVPGREKNQTLGAPLVRICVGTYPVQASMMKYVLCLSRSNHVRNLNNQGFETVLISWLASLMMSTFLLSGDTPLLASLSRKPLFLCRKITH